MKTLFITSAPLSFWNSTTTSIVKPSRSQMTQQFIVYKPFLSNSNPSSISKSQTLICSSFRSSNDSNRRRKPIISARDRIIDFGKHKGRMLGTLPSSYLKWVAKTLITQDVQQWGKLADEVLQDPVYRDRIEWEFADNLLTGDRGIGAARVSDNPASDLLDISKRFGWDFDDELGWSRIDFTLLGSSKGGRIPRKGSGSGSGSDSDSRVSQKGKNVVGSAKSDGKARVSVEGEEKRGSREERRERQRLKRGLQTHKAKLEMLRTGSKEEEDDDRDHRDRNEDLDPTVKTASNPFPGRETLLRKALNKKGNDF